jgi:pimeloyl-ACP methyl ester carboxylesterase
VTDPRPVPARYARNGAAGIAFEELGGAGGEPLLLVMGLGVSRFWWPPGLVAELAGQGFHVAAYDQRDAGESTHFPAAGAGSASPGERPPGTPRGANGVWPASRQTPSRSPLAAALRRRSVAYTAEDMTDDAVAVLDALGWDSAHLFGHSMGGQLAQRTALRHRQRVRSLTSSASLPSDTGGLAAARYVHLGLVARMARMRFPEGRDGDIAVGLALARAVASPGYPFDEAEARARIERDLVSGVRDTAAQSRQVGAKWHGGRLSELRVPALVLHGERDPLLRPAAARRTAAAIDGARLVLLPGVGHDLPAAVWPQVASEVRALAGRAAVRAGG